MSRFGDFQTNLNIPRPVLGDRLALLTTHGSLVREAYQNEGQRVRQAYRLTEKGADLLPELVALMQWGDHYLTGDAEPAVLPSHKGCGARVQVELACASGRPVETAAELKVQVRSGAKGSS